MTKTEHETSLAASMAPWTTGFDYAVDAWQRSILFLDVLRQRGNQYHEHMAEQAPHVLHFQAELVMDGRKLSRPANYGLVRITPPPGVIIDEKKRPFVVTAHDGQTVEAHALIIATGARANYLGLTSEDKYKNRGVSACAVCDGRESTG